MTVKQHIQELGTPINIPFGNGNATATHVAYGHIHHPGHSIPMNTYTVLGYMDGGNFQRYPGTEQYAQIKDANYTALLAADSPKPAGQFNTTDLINMHDTIIGAPRAAL